MGRGKNKRVTVQLTSLLMTLFLTVFYASSEQTPYNNPAAGKTKIVFIPKVTAVNNTNHDGVTRISISIEGIPHTSNRIDAAELRHAGKTFSAVDIDGIDFERYFQFEDEGIIEIEMDFPKIKNMSPEDKITFKTVHGDFDCIIGPAITSKK